MEDSFFPIYFQKRFSNSKKKKNLQTVSFSRTRIKLPLSSDKEIMILFIYILHRDPCSQIHKKSIRLVRVGGTSVDERGNWRGYTNKERKRYFDGEGKGNGEKQNFSWMVKPSYERLFMQRFATIEMIASRIISKILYYRFYFILCSTRNIITIT